MSEFEVAGETYRSGRMDAFTQFHVMRKLAPLLASLRQIGSGEGGAGEAGAPVGLDGDGGLDALAALAPLAHAVAGMSDADSEYVLGVTLAVCERRISGGRGWARVWNAAAKRPMFDDIDAPAMLHIAFAVLRESLAGFFSRTAARIERRGGTINFEPARLPDNLDWLLRPVARGLCRYESLKDGSLDLADVALMNEAIDVIDENQVRARLAMRQK